MNAFRFGEFVFRPYHAERPIAANWQSIGAYDKVNAASVLLRGEGQIVFGLWSAPSDPEEQGERTWRSMEDSTLDSPLWFEPTHFAVLKDDYEQFFLQR
jgi:hypothetical protein